MEKDPDQTQAFAIRFRGLNEHQLEDLRTFIANGWSSCSQQAPVVNKDRSKQNNFKLKYDYSHLVQTSDSTHGAH